jgi:tetratricopeptide (TPR) repeat protein
MRRTGMQRITRIVLGVLMIATGPHLLACLQGFGTAFSGATITTDGLVGDELVEALNGANTTRVYWQRQKRLQTPQLPKANFYERNDYAVTLLHLGEIRPALDILLQNERLQPREYATAANIGTAYELAGDNKQALRWIRESLVRNARAHNGTEWLHVKILEAKLARAADPKWLSTHTVLGLDFGDGPIPKIPKVLPAGNDGKPVSGADLDYAIWYQLHERYQFVSPPDPYVASLLFDWANHSFRTGTLETADAVYREAIRFGYHRPDLLKQRRQRVAVVLQRAKSAK